LHFRRALAHLTNKAKYTTDYMGGYGYILQTFMPVPALEGFTDYSTLSNSTALADPYGSAGGYLYKFDRAAATCEFWLGGFVIQISLTYIQWYSSDATLRAGAKAGDTKISLLPSTPTGKLSDSFKAGDKIQIGQGDNAEYAYIATGGVDDTTGTLTLTLPLVHDHPLHSPSGDPVVGVSSAEALPNMKFWIRLDDPNRRQAGEDLYNEMILAGIPAAATAGGAGLEKHIAERSTCFTNVMVAYDYNIYTGGWSLTADPDFLYDLAHSSMGQYSYANNYAGFKNHEYDVLAEKVKFPVSLSDVPNAAIQAQWVMQKYTPIIWLWAAKGVKGYRTGYTGVVNQAGFGTDNGWSFNEMYWNPTQPYMTRTGPADTIVYGFKSDISALQVLTSEWVWDWNVLSEEYDTLIARNPYNLPEEVGGLATAWNASNNYPGWVGKTVTQFTLRTDATFHDGSPVTPGDIVYSLLAVKDAGAGNAWNYPTVFEIDHIQIQGQIIRVFWTVLSAFAMHWAGFMPIINSRVWNKAIGPGTASGYSFVPPTTDGTYTGGTYVAALNIRNYHPWLDDANGNGIIDLKEDGSWCWQFVSYTVGNTVVEKAWASMYNTMARKPDPSIESYQMMTIEAFKTAAFHGIGNVNYASGYGVAQLPAWYASDNVINIFDLTTTATSMPSSSSGTWGKGPSQYNPDADINNDGAVNIIDLSIAGTNYGKKSG